MVSHPGMHSNYSGGPSNTRNILCTVSWFPVPSTKTVCLQQVKPVASLYFPPALDPLEFCSAFAVYMHLRS